MNRTNFTFSEFHVALFECSENLSLSRWVQIFRKDLFVDRLRWTLPCENGLEIDEFDRPDTVYCAVFCFGRLVATWRAIRSDKPYLAREKFPQLAINRSYPAISNVWEISRFGVIAPEYYSQAADANFASMFTFGRMVNAKSFVAVTDPVYERYLRIRSIRTRRYGPPQEIGTDLDGRPIEAVAGEIPLDPDTNPHIDTFLKLNQEIQINDDIMAQRAIGISA